MSWTYGFESHQEHLRFFNPLFVTFSMDYSSQPPNGSPSGTGSSSLRKAPYKALGLRPNETVELTPSEAASRTAAPSTKDVRTNQASCANITDSSLKRNLLRSAGRWSCLLASTTGPADYYGSETKALWGVRFADPSFRKLFFYDKKNS